MGARVVAVDVFRRAGRGVAVHAPVHRVVVGRLLALLAQVGLPAPAHVVAPILQHRNRHDLAAGGCSVHISSPPAHVVALGAADEAALKTSDEMGAAMFSAGAAARPSEVSG